MCGRFTLKQPVAALAQAFHVQSVPDVSAQYNVAPTQLVTTVIHNVESNKREFQQLRWGLIPSWAKDPGIGVKLINAISETVTEKPSFRFKPTSVGFVCVAVTSSRQGCNKLDFSNNL